jgi:hypothetical protein
MTAKPGSSWLVLLGGLAGQAAPRWDDARLEPWVEEIPAHLHPFGRLVAGVTMPRRLAGRAVSCLAVR